MSLKHVLLLLMLPLLTACEMVCKLLEIPDAQKPSTARHADDATIGGAFWNTTRSLQDSCLLNPGAKKAAILTGWHDIHNYMAKLTRAKPKARPRGEHVT